MDGGELARIRQQRLAQLQAQQGASQAPGGQNAGPAGDRNNDKQKEAQEREAEMRNNILSSVLTQEARARLATIGAAKPDRAHMIENIIMQNARMGAIRGKVDEDALKGLLEKVSSQTKRETKVNYERRRVFDDSDEDNDD